jgi:hypothetical protein
MMEIIFSVTLVQWLDRVALDLVDWQEFDRGAFPKENRLVGNLVRFTVIFSDHSADLQLSRFFLSYEFVNGRLVDRFACTGGDR